MEMILDDGICSVFSAKDGADAGEMPAPEYTLLYQSWYGELQFETSPAYPTDGRREQQTDQRVRVMQCRDIRQDDIAVLLDVSALSDAPEGTPQYRITRCYHGFDDDGVTPITDMSLEDITP